MASAGYGLDHVTAIDLLKTVRCRNGFVVSIFLRPFSFEGQRRQDEVGDTQETVDMACFFTEMKIRKKRIKNLYFTILHTISQR